MSGIFGGLNLKGFDFKCSENNLLQESYVSDKLVYGRRYIDKFRNERFVIENSDFACVFEGFLFNLYGFKTQRELFENRLSFKALREFIQDLDGIFSLFIYFKKEQKFYLVTDHLAAMKIFYSKINDEFVFSSDLFDVTKYYNKTQKKISVDIDSAYFFLGFGSVVSNRTLFENIYKLESGTYLEFDLKANDYKVVEYHNLAFNTDHKISEEEIVDKYEAIISKAMDRMVELNRTYKLDNVAGLSGGLDSKSMVVAMHQKNVDSLTTFTFAEYGSLDQSIAQDVSSKLGTAHIAVALDNGWCLEYNFEKIIKRSNGMIAVHTLLHGYNSLQKVNVQPIGLLLTGQIGDAIFGSHVIGKKTVKEYITSKSHYSSVPEFIYSKIGYIESLLSRYDRNNSEAYIYEGRISNGTMYGDIVIRDDVDTLTPFYSKELLDFALTVPEHFRVDEKIYLKWLKKYHPQVLSFKWDKCDCKPTNHLKVRVFKYLHSLRNAVKKRLKLRYDGMNPFDVWFRNNPLIMEKLEARYRKNLDLLNFNSELKQTAIKLYNSDVDRYKRNKFVVVTFLLSLKLHLSRD